MSAIVYWHWLILALLLIIVDVFAASMTVLWFGAAALVVSLLAFLLPGLPIGWLLLIWVILAVGMAWLWFKVFRPQQQTLTLKDVKGEWATVISAQNGERAGTLRFSYPIKGASEWRFIGVEGQNIQLGDRVLVEDIGSDHVLLIKKHHQQP